MSPHLLSDYSEVEEEMSTLMEMALGGHFDPISIFNPCSYFPLCRALLVAMLRLLVVMELINIFFLF